MGNAGREAGLLGKREEEKKRVKNVKLQERVFSFQRASALVLARDLA